MSNKNSPTFKMWATRFQNLKKYSGPIGQIILFPVTAVTAIVSFLHILYFTDEYEPLNFFAWILTIFGLVIGFAVNSSIQSDRAEPLAPELLNDYINISSCYKEKIVPLMQKGVTIQKGHHINVRDDCGIVDLVAHTKQQELLKSVTQGN